MANYKFALILMVVAIGLSLALNFNTFFPPIEVDNENILNTIKPLNSKLLEANHNNHESQQSKTCGTAQLQGRRSYQEDRILCMPNIFTTSNGMNISLFGVFDGHSGHEASEWPSNKLQQTFLRHFHAKRVDPYTHSNPPNIYDISSLEQNIKTSTTLDNTFENSTLAKHLKEALAEVISEIESTFLVEAFKKNLKSGTTASIVLQAGTHILVANIGDSKTILCSTMACTPTPPRTLTRREQRLNENRVRRHVEDVCGHGPSSVVELSRDHRPDREDEQLRIESVGGFVESYGGLPRVNGQLAVSRSIGDFAFKKYGFVTANPEWTGWLDTSHVKSHLVMASHGIFEKLTTNEVCGVVSATMSGVDISKALGFQLQSHDRAIVLEPSQKQTSREDESDCKNDIKVELPQRVHDVQKLVNEANNKIQKDLQDGSVHDATNDAKLVARAIVEAALRSGSQDNLSALVVFFAS